MFDCYFSWTAQTEISKSPVKPHADSTFTFITDETLSADYRREDKEIRADDLNKEAGGSAI